MKLKRRDFLKKVSLATLAGGSTLLGGCNQGQSVAAGAAALPTDASTETPVEKIKSVNVNTNGTLEWKLVTSWPSNLSIFDDGARLLAEQIELLSQGRLKIEVFAAGELVPAFGTLEAVDTGQAEMGHSAAYYWADTIPATPFFTSVPFGMNAQQMYSWIFAGDGLKLWEEVYQAFNIVPLAVGATGVQMGGWFNKEINSLDDFKGLKMRIPGLGGQTIAQLGASPELLAAGEIYPSLESGAIDATEWVGPLHDSILGLHRIAKFYYYPGWHEPSTVLELQINRQAFEALPADLQGLIRMVAQAQTSWMLAQFESQNLAALQKLINEEGVAFKLFPYEVMAGLQVAAEAVIQDVADSDPMAKKVFESYQKFQEEASLWGNVSERAYYNLIQKSL